MTVKDADAVAGMRLLFVELKAQRSVDAESKTAPTGLLDANRGLAFVQTTFEEHKATLQIISELG